MLETDVRGSEETNEQFIDNEGALALTAQSAWDARRRIERLR